MRISLATLRATGVGFFGFYGSSAAHKTRWKLVANDGTGAPTLTDMGARIGIATGGVFILFIAAPLNGRSV